jgi:branched-chain amino acid transport system ATP-binding protein
VLEVRGLHVHYGKVQAVRGLSVTATPGRITMVLGSNGAGKTTTMRAIAGLLPIAAGQVLLDGQDITGLPAHRLVKRGMALVPEGRRVFAPLTVEENLRLGGYSVSRSARDVAMERAYDLFPILRERRKGAAGLLSGGEQQMLAFARAVMSAPRYVLMDEPSMGLAPAVIEVVMDQARSIADSGVGVLMVEQNADLGLAVADDVVVIMRGEVLFSGTRAEARSNSAVIEAFLGEAALHR